MSDRADHYAGRLLLSKCPHGYTAPGLCAQCVAGVLRNAERAAYRRGQEAMRERAADSIRYLDPTLAEICAAQQIKDEKTE